MFLVFAKRGHEPTEVPRCKPTVDRLENVSHVATEGEKSAEGIRMQTRRAFALGAASLPLLPGTAFGQDSHKELNPNLPPLLQDRADFSGIWSSDAIPEIIAGTPPPDVASGLAEKYSKVVFKNYDELDSYFRQQKKNDFISWFNKSVAKRRYWANRDIHGANVHEHFKEFWAAYLTSSPRTLIEFVAYMAVFINEIDGDLIGRSEQINLDRPGVDHPGIAYLFDEVIITSGSQTWKKASYNQSPNITCSQLFSLLTFNAAHGAKAFGLTLANTKDPAWSGHLYPSGVPSSANPQLTGYILEADFFKFRGRGLIQTTWRRNYLPLVEFVVQKSSGSVAQSFKTKWTSLPTNDIVTVSSNKDWDDLFSDPEKEILCEAIRIHAQQGNYLPLSSTTSELNGNDSGSIIAFGNRIGGGGYGARLKGRVTQIFDALEAGE